MSEGSANIGQSVVNWAVKVTVPLLLGGIAWLFGTTSSLKDEVIILKTQGPFIQKQLDRLEQKVDATKGEVESMSSKVDTLVQKQHDRDKEK